MKTKVPMDHPDLLTSLIDGEDSKEGRIVDWLGRPESGKRLGGWHSALRIAVAFAFGGIAFSGINSNLVVYLMDVWKQTNAAVSTNYTNLSGFTFLTPLFGAFLAETYLGRLWTIFLFQLILLLGCTLVSWTATLQQNQRNQSNTLFSFQLLSLYVMCLGQGSYQAIMLTFAGDQLDNPEDKAKIFNGIIVTEYTSQVFCLTVLASIESSGMWALGFWISTTAIGIGIILFIISAPKCRQYRAGGNPLVRLMQVFAAAIRKLGVKVSPGDTDMLYELPGRKSAIPGSRKLPHTKGFRWLDKAAAITNEDFVTGSVVSANRWKLCTVTQVEEVKCLGRILPVSIVGIFFITDVVQGATLFIEQAQTMDRHFGRFTIPSASLQLSCIFSAVACAAVFEFVLVPFFRRRTGLRKGITSLQRIGLGIFVVILALVVAGFVERKRLDMARFYGSVNNPVIPVPLSVFWLLPQFSLLGIAQNCFFVGYTDFVYGELSDGMKSFGASISGVIQVFGGNYLSSVLVASVNDMTGRNGSKSWIYENLNEGHVDYFYWVLAGITLLIFIVFLGGVSRYEYMNVKNEEDEDGVEEQSS